MTIIERDRAANDATARDMRRPVLALHAAASSGEQWQGLTDYLRGRYRVIAPDLAQYDSARLQPARHARDFAEWLAGALDHKTSLHVIGHSLGAAVALELAVSYPHLVRSLTLIEPTVFHLLRRGERSDRALHDELARLLERMLFFVAADDAAAAMRAYVDFWYGNGAWRRTGAGLRKRLADQAERVAFDLAASLARAGASSRFGTISCPTLVIKGLQSPVTSLRVTELVAGMVPGARLMMVGDAGHMAPLTHPHVIDPLIGGHLTSVDQYGRNRPILYRAA